MHILKVLAPLLMISLSFISSSLLAQGPVIKDGEWEAVFSAEMNATLDEQVKMLDAMAKTEPSMQVIKDKVLAALKKAKKPRTIRLSEEQAERGVISIFEQSDNATKKKGVACKHEIEWLEKHIGQVSGTCEDGSIIKGEVSIPSDLEIHYKATVTPVDGSPYPVGWDAKWLNSYKHEADDVY